MSEFDSGVAGGEPPLDLVGGSDGRGSGGQFCERLAGPFGLGRSAVHSGFHGDPPVLRVRVRGLGVELGQDLRVGRQGLLGPVKGVLQQCAPGLVAEVTAEEQTQQQAVARGCGLVGLGQQCRGAAPVSSGAVRLPQLPGRRRVGQCERRTGSRESGSAPAPRGDCGRG